MNADQKLLAVEFAANSIEFQTTRSFPKLSRGTLLDKYNFLVLPGTAKIRRNEQNRVSHKTKFCTYQELRRIALTGTVSPEDVEFVDFYNKGKTGGMTDKLVEGIEKLKIPLRLRD